MADTVLTLGGFVFADPFSVPESINGGGQHKLITTRFLGGSRVVDAMGPDDDPIRWQGRFRGAAAVAQVALLDVMRRSGRAVVLSYWSFAYKVVVKRFTWKFLRFYEVEYEIECELVQDLRAKAWRAQAASLDSLFGEDMGLGDTVTSASADLSARMAAVRTAVAAAGSLNLGSFGDVGSAVSGLQAASMIASVAADGLSGDVGGVSSGGDASAMGSALTTQSEQLSTASAGVTTSGVAGRMGQNLGHV